MNEQNIGYQLGMLFRRIMGISWASSTGKAETESNPTYNIIEEDNDEAVPEIKVFEEYNSIDSETTDASDCDFYPDGWHAAGINGFEDAGYYENGYKMN